MWMPRIPITQNRLEIAEGMAKSQHSMRSTAKAVGMKYETYRQRLGKLHKIWLAEGLTNLKSRALGLIPMMDEKDGFNASMKYLERYEVLGSDDDVVADGPSVIADATQSIMDELK